MTPAFFLSYDLSLPLRDTAPPVKSTRGSPASQAGEGLDSGLPAVDAIEREAERNCAGVPELLRRSITLTDL